MNIELEDMKESEIMTTRLESPHTSRVGFGFLLSYENDVDWFPLMEGVAISYSRLRFRLKMDSYEPHTKF